MHGAYSFVCEVIVIATLSSLALYCKRSVDDV